MKPNDTTIINTLRILARDIESEDGVANIALQEAAERFCQLIEQRRRVRGLMMQAAQQLETWNAYVISCGHDECGHTCSRVDDLIAELRKEAQG